MFAKATGVLAKTDRLDARVLAQFASIMTPAARPPAPEAMEELAELVTARASAVAGQTALKNQLAVAATTFLQRQLSRRIASANKDIDALESECLKRIKADESLAERYAILISIPSVGSVVAITLIACLTELGSCNAKQIAMLAGLAPIADESGERRGVRVIWGGRSEVRGILYLAAVAATRCNPDLKTIYRRLRDSGKPAKLALIAIARKLVILANTLIAQGRSWQPAPPAHP